MKMTRARGALVVVDLVAALSAVVGGIAVAVGWIEFPAEWLEGTPFTGYTIPALVLCLVVGGSAVLATVVTLHRADVGAAASAVAGVVMMGWIVGEVAMLGPHGAYTWLQPAYFAVGLAMAALALATVRPELAARSGGGEAQERERGLGR